MVDKISNMAKLHTYYVTNAKTEFSSIVNNMTNDEFEKIIQDYTTSLELEDDVFNYKKEDEVDDDFNSSILDNNDYLDIMKH
jgi:hypothetical protein